MTIITVDSVGKKFDLVVSGAGIISLYELDSYLNRTGKVFKSFDEIDIYYMPPLEIHLEQIGKRCWFINNKTPYLGEIISVEHGKFNIKWCDGNLVSANINGVLVVGTHIDDITSDKMSFKKLEYDLVCHDIEQLNTRYKQLQSYRQQISNELYYIYDTCEQKRKI